jgi:phosphopantothenoylcysteine decarboxylase/phosphopantothenate--cysteine ligase
VNKQDFAGKAVVVTAGGTQEPIDPVRHIGNRSSGKMGYALAEAARDRGAEVTLITAPTALPEPPGIKIIRVRTSYEMREAVLKAVVGAEALMMAAAVSDYRINGPSDQKIKREHGNIILELVPTSDILSEVPDTIIKIGFAAESENLIINAKKKLEQKRLDMIVANDITAADSGFDADTNRVSLIDKTGRVEELPLMKKREAAEIILDRLTSLFGEAGKA